MTTIDRARFVSTLSGGINLNDSQASAALTQGGVSVEALRKLDNGDGQLKGEQELSKAFALVDRFDHNNSSTSFDTSGKAGDTYQALLQAAAASGAKTVSAQQLAAGPKELPRTELPKAELPKAELPKGAKLVPVRPGSKEDAALYDAKTGLQDLIRTLEAAKHPGVKALKESLDGVNALIEAKEKGPVTASSVSAVMFKATAALVEWSASSMTDPKSIQFAKDGAELLDKVGAVFGLPAAAVDMLSNLNKAWTGLDEKGQELSKLDHLRAVVDLGLNTKDLYEGLSASYEGLKAIGLVDKVKQVGTKAAGAVSQRLPQLAARLQGIGQNVLPRLGAALEAVGPLMIATQLTETQARWIMTECYRAQQGMSQSMLTAHLGAAPEELARRIQSLKVTPENALDVVRMLQDFTFNKGGQWNHGTTAQQEWTRFMQSRLLTDFVTQTMISVLNSDRAGGKVETGHVAWIVADKLQSLAVEFIAQQKQNAKLDN